MRFSFRYHVLHVFVAVLLLGSAGCSKNSDPVQELKDHVSHAANAVDERHPDWRWHIIRYDVQKNDSLVSPYIGTISAESYSKWEGKPDRRDNYDLTLAYQDGKWVLTDLTWQVFSKGFGEWDPVDEKETMHSGQQVRASLDSAWLKAESKLHLR